MALTTVLLVLASALIHSLWNAILKRTRSPEDAVMGMVVVSALAAASFALVTRAPLPPPRSLAWTVGSGLFEWMYFVTLARALTRAPLGPVYTTVRGGALLIVWPASLAFLGEKMTPSIAAGTVLVMVGLVATGWSGGPRAEPDAEPLVVRLRWSFLCAAFVGGYQIAYKLALSSGGTPNAVVAISISVAGVLNVIVIGRERRRRSWKAARAQPVHTLVAGVLTHVGFAVFLYAMARAGAGVVTTLRNTSILFTQIIAVFLGERPTRSGIAGAVLVMIGVFLLSR